MELGQVERRRESCVDGFRCVCRCRNVDPRFARPIDVWSVELRVVRAWGCGS
jgi:hypothetical protein